VKLGGLEKPAGLDRSVPRQVGERNLHVGRRTAAHAPVFQKKLFPGNIRHLGRPLEDLRLEDGRPLVNADGAHDHITKPIDLDYLESSVMVKMTDILG
jgi:hypothetical protein